MSSDVTMTPRRIATWLRRFKDWKAYLGALASGPSMRSIDLSRPSVSAGRRGGGGPAQRYAEEREELGQRVATVEWWLKSLSRLERLAAEYWLRDQDGTITSVSEAMGLDWRHAKQLVEALPLIIWGRFYDGEQTFAKKS